MKTVIIVGIPGVGKSTIAEKIIIMLRKNGIKAKLFDVGNTLFKIAREEFSISEKSEARKSLPINKHKYLQLKLIKSINELKRTNTDIVILDTHIFIKKGINIYLPGWTLYMLRNLNLDGMIVVKAPITDIIHRRKKGEKVRDEDSEKILKTHQNLTMIGAVTVSILTGSPIILVDNLDGNVENVIKRIVETIKKTILIDG